MTETKFTPGPWLRIHDHPNEDTRLAMASIRPVSESDRESGDIATLFLCNYPEGGVAEAQRANANLIAASPCMFKALSALLDLRENTSPFGGELQEDRIERAFDNARAALAKARGES